MSEHRGAFATAGPVRAGHVAGAAGESTIGCGASEDVVHVYRIAATGNCVAFFSEHSLLVEIVVGAVKIGDAAGNDDALRIAPRSCADAIACVDDR